MGYPLRMEGAHSPSDGSCHVWKYIELQETPNEEQDSSTSGGKVRLGRSCLCLRPEYGSEGCWGDSTAGEEECCECRDVRIL
jgi:hypothetical protein